MLPRFRPDMTLSMHLKAMSQGARLAGNRSLARNLSDASAEVTWSRLECIEASPIGWSILRPDSELREMGL